MTVLRVLLVAGLLAGLGFLGYAWEPALDPIEPPAENAFAAAAIEQGGVLAGAGNCATCHSLPGGPDYAGGYAMNTGFGTVYSTNITPHPEAGIGRWSEAAFVRAMREGVSRDGSHLYPAFPYTHYTQVTDADLSALYAYFMTREPSVAAIPDNTLPFPLNVRLLQAGWKLLFFDEGRFEPASDRNERWNRGAYLAEGLGHCGACHTPRNALGAERAADAYAGAMVDGWYAPALDGSDAVPLPWTADELYAFLRRGASALHGVAAGSMSEVVHSGLVHLPDADIDALAGYFADLDGAPQGLAAAEVETAMQGFDVTDAADLAGRRGAALYASACDSCHYNRPGEPLEQRPELSLNSAIHAPHPDNLVRLILGGVSRPGGDPALYMHGYAGAFSDADIAAVAGYLRARYVAPGGAGSGSWDELERRVQEMRQGMEAAE